MGKITKPLSDAEIKRAKILEKDYALYDGSGLQLTVRTNGSKVFEFRYKSPTTQKAQKITLGKYPILSLSDAREKRAELQKTLLNGMDPKEERDATKHDGILFEKAALEYEKFIKSQLAEPTFKRSSSLIHKELVRVFAKKPIKEITRFQILALVREIEDRGHIVNAKKALSVMSGLLRYALSCGYVEHNVALDIDKAMLKKTETTNYAHIEEEERLKTLIAAMHQGKSNPIIKLATFFALHTFLRPKNVRFLEWVEVDFDNKMILIPAEKMKTRKPHLVPLTDATITILREAKKHTAHHQYIFTMPSGCVLGSNEMNRFLKKIGFVQEQKVHGFRHTASTILHERMHLHGIHSDAIERQLAHAEMGVKGVYNKAEYISERVKLMHWWSDFVSGQYTLCTLQNQKA